MGLGIFSITSSRTSWNGETTDIEKLWITVVLDDFEDSLPFLWNVKDALVLNNNVFKVGLQLFNCFLHGQFDERLEGVGFDLGLHLLVALV